VIQGILLAGGTGSRFGAQKLLHPLPDGQAIGAHSARHMIEALGSVLVVTRPGQPELLRIFAETGARVLESPCCVEGMGASLAAAVTASADASGWIVALADMPYLDPANIRAVQRALESGASIVVPVHEGVRGHPVGFGAEWSGALRSLQGDEGARSILLRNAERIQELVMTDANIRRDVDTPADLN
jgi:molybdenum cofactor cytidylyltransferase